MLLELFWMFLKIGAFTFGGGYAMIPLIQSEVVGRGLMTQAQLIDFVAVSESTPGPMAVNIATFVGANVGGFPGALCATLGVTLPSFLIILLVARGYQAFSKSRIVSGCLSGLRPAVVGLIGAAALSVGQTVFFPGGWTVTAAQAPRMIFSAVILIGAMLLSAKKLHPIWIILIAGALGVAAGYAGLLGV